MTPAEELRAAATRLRRAATKAMPGPWESMDDDDRIVAWKMTPEGFDDDFDYVIDEPTSHGGNATWIALVNPALAEPLAAWLEALAVGWQESTDLFPDGAQARFGGHPALAVARAINGGAS